MGMSVGLCWAAFLTELLFLPVMLGWRCPSSSCTRSLMTVSCVGCCQKISGEEAILVQGESSQCQGPALPSVGWAQLSWRGVGAVFPWMGTAVQLCEQGGRCPPHSTPFPLPLFPGKHPSIEESCQLKCPFCTNLHIFSLPVPFSLCLSLEYS